MNSNKPVQAHLFAWIARILAILYVIFISLFALDVFQPGIPLGELLIGLFMHLIPSLVIAAVIWIAWKNPLVGGILFIATGLGFSFFFHTESWSTFAIIAAPPILIGLIFLIESALSRQKSRI